MVTVVNSPNPNQGSNTGLIVAIVLGVLLFFAVLFWGSPALRRGSVTERSTNPPSQINIDVDGGEQSTESETVNDENQTIPTAIPLETPAMSTATPQSTPQVSPTP